MTLGPSNNRLAGSGSPVIETEAKPVRFRKALYNKETGATRVFESLEEAVEAEESGDWVDSPVKTTRGEYLKRPESCEFYVGRKCSKVCDCEKDKVVEVEGPVKGDVWVEPIEPLQVKDPEAPKPYLSQMNHAQLVEEGQLYGFDFFDGKTTKAKMERTIRAAKEAKAKASK